MQQHSGSVRDGGKTLGIDEEWKTILPQLPISYQGVSGGETIRGRQIEAEATGLVTAAWSPMVAAITPRMRLKMGGRKLEIISVLNLDGKNQEITMQVSEKT